MKTAALCLVCVLFIASPAAARTKRALVIGLGQYQDATWERIHGDKDVPLVKHLLIQDGFSDIRTLVNQEATKAAIVAALQKLARRCDEGDVVYIHFSGHGQRMTDIDGDEPDGWDEAWVPYDACRRYGQGDDGSKHLSDDELAVLLSDIRKSVGSKGSIVVVADACHSGDSTRGGVVDSDEPPVRGVYDNFVIPGTPEKGARRAEEQWLTLSACKDYQLNQEAPGGYGKLTYALSQLWNKMRGMDNEQVEGAVVRFMQRKDMQGRYPQTPVLSGDRQRYAFNELFTR